MNSYVILPMIFLSMYFNMATTLSLSFINNMAVSIVTSKSNFEGLALGKAASYSEQADLWFESQIHFFHLVP